MNQSGHVKNLLSFKSSTVRFCYFDHVTTCFLSLHVILDTFKNLLQTIFKNILGKCIDIDIINQSNAILVFQFENDVNQGTSLIHSTDLI